MLSIEPSTRPSAGVLEFSKIDVEKNSREMLSEKKEPPTESFIDTEIIARKSEPNLGIGNAGWITCVRERVEGHRKILTLIDPLIEERGASHPSSLGVGKTESLTLALEARRVAGYAAFKDEKNEKEKFLESLKVVAHDVDQLLDVNENFSNKWHQYSALIDAVNKEDVDTYADFLLQHTRLYQGVSDILSKLGKLVTASEDNKMTVDFFEINKEFERLIGNYKPPKEGYIIAGAVSGGLSQEQAERICKKLKLPDACVAKNGDSTYCVIPNIEKIETMHGALRSKEKESISVATYNAWKSGFDAQMTLIEGDLQDISRKYTQAFSKLDVFYKAISSMIQAMTDILKIYANSIRGA